MTKATLGGWVLTLVCLSWSSALRAGDFVLTPDEAQALRQLQGEAPPEPVADMRTDEERERGTWHYGLQLLGSSPRQDFREITSRTGYGLGVLVENDLGHGWRVQSRFDYIRFPQVNGTYIGEFAPGVMGLTATDLTLSANSVDVGADVHYHLPYPSLGRCFLLAGLMGIRYEFSYTLATSTTDPVTQQATARIQGNKYKTNLKLGADVGVGFDLSRNFTLAGRCTYIDIDGTTYVTYETDLSVRF